MDRVPLAALEARARLAALADPGSLALDAPAGASPDLARFGIAARDDDGIVTGRARLDGREVLVAAQDERFLRGSVGRLHGGALAALAARALAERPAALVLLLASGGVRLHEANAAELSLAAAASSPPTTPTWSCASSSPPRASTWDSPTSSSTTRRRFARGSGSRSAT